MNVYGRGIGQKKQSVRNASDNVIMIIKRDISVKIKSDIMFEYFMMLLLLEVRIYH